LRRSQGISDQKKSVLSVGGVSIDTEAHQVSCNGESVQLTISEFKLLLALAQNQGRVLTRAKLMDLVQGSGVSVVDRTIDTHIFGLRKKMGSCGDQIETIRGVGYRMQHGV
jgi:two-component system phosphate regulon response regulator PhoB